MSKKQEEPTTVYPTLRITSKQGKELTNSEWDAVSKKLHVQWENPRKESRNIQAFAYSGEEATLALKFHSGKVYTYEKVPLDLYRTLLVIDSSQTESLGKWVIANITSQQSKYPFKPQN